MHTSQDLLDEEARLAGQVIDLNGLGTVYYQGRLWNCLGGPEPLSLIEFRKHAVAARVQAAKLIEAADHMDRLLVKALS